MVLPEWRVYAAAHELPPENSRMPTAALAGLLALSAFDASQVGRPTPDAAALAALSAARAASREYEYGGALFECDGLYYYTTPATKRENDALDLRIRLPARAHLTALYHTHPGTNPAAFAISGGDIDAARAAHGAMYVGVIERGTVLFFDPSHDAKRYRARGSRQFPF